MQRLPRRNTRWTPEEDEQLRKYITEHGVNDWGNAEDLFKRTGKACCGRWKHCLRSTVALLPFSDEEKARIRELYDMLGPKWNTLRKRTLGDFRFPINRTESDIKNYMAQVLLQRAQHQDPDPNDVNDNDGNLQASEEDIDQNNEEVGSHGNQSSDLSLSVRVPPSVARNNNLNDPPPLDDALD